MTIETLSTAFEFTEAAIAAIGDDQWENPTPCSEWNLRELVNHTIGAVFGMGTAAAGQQPPQGDSPDFTHDNPTAAFRQAADAALDAWPTALDKTINLGPAEMPGDVAIGVNLLDTLTHGWDIATASDQPASLPDEPAKAALAAAQMILTDELRATAGFGPAINVGEQATPTETLVAFLGRQP